MTQHGILIKRPDSSIHDLPVLIIPDEVVWSAQPTIDIAYPYPSIPPYLSSVFSLYDMELNVIGVPYPTEHSSYCTLLLASCELSIRLCKQAPYFENWRGLISNLLVVIWIVMYIVIPR